jgi:hypothetical protein
MASEQLGEHREAGLFLGRALELFGSENSNLYGIPMAARFFAQHGLAPRADSLLAHWIPVLRERLQLAPDNYRVLGVLIWLEGLAGDSANCRARAGTLLDLVSREPDANVAGFNFVIPGLVAAGLEPELHQVLRGIEHRELSPMHPILWLGSRSEPISADGRLSPAASAALLSLRAHINRDVDDLRRRYLPAVGLKRRRQ